MSTILSDLEQRESGLRSTRDTCEDLARAVNEQFPLILTVTGSPVTHLTDVLSRISSGHTFAVNEKTALESAVGASIAGQRCCVIMKHNGLGCVVDTLANAGLHTTGNALVVIVGDDPDAASSTSAVDSRLLAEAAGIPMLEPTLHSDCGRIIEAAIDASERHNTPILVRVTPALHALCSSSAGHRAFRVDHPGATSDPCTSHDRSHVAFGLTKLGRVQWQRMTTLPGVAESTNPIASSEECYSGEHGSGIVTFGAAAQHCDVTDACRIFVRRAWPLPEDVIRFAEQHTDVLVIEESAPHFERLLRTAVRKPSRIRGRMTGHLPPDGALNHELVKSAVLGVAHTETTAPQVKSLVSPESGDYRTLFTALGELRRQGVFVAADVGSSVRVCYPPYDGADVSLTLGSAGAVAAGAARAGRIAIGVLGDFALLHSGIESVIDAAIHHLPVLLVVLVNGIQAKTGGQPVPGIDLEQLLRGCGLTHIDQWNLDDLNAAQTRSRLNSLLTLHEPAAALIVSQPEPETTQERS